MTKIAISMLPRRHKRPQFTKRGRWKWGPQCAAECSDPLPFASSDRARQRTEPRPSVDSEVSLEHSCSSGIGLAVGLVLAVGLARLLVTLIYGAHLGDSPTFVLVSVVLTLTALTACLVPAYWATCVDPTRALRTE